MKTQIKAILLTIALFTIFLSCSESGEEETVYQEQNFLPGLLMQLGFSSPEFGSDGFPFQFGLSFTPLVNGTLNSFMVKVPTEFSGSIKLWEKSTGTLVYTKDLGLLENMELFVNVDPIILSKDKEYIITVLTLASNVRTNVSNINPTFPAIIGDIQINYLIPFANPINKMPSNRDNSYYSGDISFNFLRTR